MPVQKSSRLHKILSVIIVTLIIPNIAFSQTSGKTGPFVPNLQPVQPNDKKIVFPVSPQGYHLQFKGSDHTPIIDSTGKIINPLVDEKVNLYFLLRSNTNDTLTYDVSKQILIPGRFTGKGVNPQPFVIPSLKEWHGDVGNYFLTPHARIVINTAQKQLLLKAAIILQKELKQQYRLSLTIVTAKPQKGDIYLTLNEKDKAIGQEGYYFKAGDMLTISAVKYKGLFWGTRTLLQLLEQGKGIPKGIARDYPEFKIRGFVLDVGRKFFTMQFLRNYVKLMSYYKMNDFQIHLNDNGFKNYFGNNWDSTYAAFRLENATYPRLTAKDGHYTKKEFIALQQLANSYAINIIPEIDVPAHALAFTKAVPQIASKLYGRDHLDLHNPITYKVIENVFKEYLGGRHPVFIGKEVHIGTDEYAKKDAEAFRAFTDHFIKYVQSFGKNARIWGALTNAAGTTPVTVKNVTMNTWYNGYANPIEMKKLGYTQISTPDGWLYIVPAAGYYYDYLDYKNIYDNWTPSTIGNITFPAGDPTIIGGAFAVWNDIVGNGISEKDVHDRVFPAMQVLAQKTWAGRQVNTSFEDFDMAAKKIGEGPSLNIRGKLSSGNDSLVVRFNFDKTDNRVNLHHTTYTKGISGEALSFSGKNSFAILPYTEIGYNYTVSFWIKPANDLQKDVSVFWSPNAVVKLTNTGNLGFARDGYNFNFGYTMPVNVWTHVIISGTNLGTSLYINGKVQRKMYADSIQFTDQKKTKVRRSETLVFPLKKVGGFRGKIDELQIWSKVLTDNEIENLK